MHRIEQAAEQSVRRGVAFGVLAIVVTACGLAAYPVLALQVAAALTLLMWAILRLKAAWAPSRPYKRTEVWIMLEPRPALAPAEAQLLIGRTLEAKFEAYARPTIRVAVGLWGTSLLVRLAGVE